MMLTMMGVFSDSAMRVNGECWRRTQVMQRCGAEAVQIIVVHPVSISNCLWDENTQ